MAVDLLGVYGDDLYRYGAIGTEAMGRGGFPDARGPMIQRRGVGSIDIEAVDHLVAQYF